MSRIPAPRTLIAALAAAALLTGCGVAKTTGKVVAAPFKVVGKTAEVAGKSVYYTGKGVYHTGKFIGEAAFMTGKGVFYVGKYTGYALYKVGSIPVVVTDAALDTTYQVLRITETTLDVAGKAYTLYREIPRSELKAYIKALKTAKNVAEVVIDAVGPDGAPVPNLPVPTPVPVPYGQPAQAPGAAPGAYPVYP